MSTSIAEENYERQSNLLERLQCGVHLSLDLLTGFALPGPLGVGTDQPYCTDLRRRPEILSSVIVASMPAVEACNIVSFPGRRHSLTKLP